MPRDPRETKMAKAVRSYAKRVSAKALYEQADRRWRSDLLAVVDDEPKSSMFAAAKEHELSESRIRQVVVRARGER